MATKLATFARPARRARQRVSTQLHPLVFDAIVGLALCLVLAAWLFFRGPEYSDIVLVVVSGLALAAVGIPYVLWRISWKHGASRVPGDEESFHDWRTEEFQTWQGRLKGRDALIQILLPIAAVAVSMIAIGVVFCLT